VEEKACPSHVRSEPGTFPAVTKPRVAMLIESLGRGGAETMLAEVARPLSRMFDLHVLALDSPYALADAIEYRGVPVARIGRSPRRRPLACLYRLLATLGRLRPDLIHTHLYYANVLGRLAGGILRVPVVSTLHNPDYTYESRSGVLFAFKKRIDRWTGARAAALVAVSRAVAEDYRAHMGWTGIEVVHNGVDLERYCPGPPDPGAFAAWPSRGLRLLAVGRLHPQKGFDTLLRALAQARSLGVSAQLAVVGTGALLAPLVSLSRELGVQDHVAWLGERSDVVDLLRAADLFVFPSRYEALGVALLEAMSCGKAVVASAVGGIPEIVEDGRSGLLVSPDDERQLAAALSRLARSEELRQGLGIAARERARSFSIERAAQGLASVFTAALAHRGRQNRVHRRGSTPNREPNRSPAGAAVADRACMVRLWGLAAISLAAHLLYVWLVPGPAVSADAAVYLELARSMAAGTGYVARGSAVTHFMPGYPAFLVPFLAGGAFALSVVRAAQAGLVALAAALAGLAAMRLWGDRAGLAACATLALLPALFVYPSVLVSECLVVALVALLVWALTRPPKSAGVRAWARWSAVPGVAAAMLVVVKPEFLVWLPLPAVVLGLRARSWKALTIAGCTTLALTAVLLAPWTVHNWRTFGVFMPLSSGSGPQIWLSAHRPALTEYESPDFQAAIVRCGGPQAPPPAVDACLRREAVSMLVDHPGYYALGALERATRLFLGSHTEYLGRVGISFGTAVRRRELDVLGVKSLLLLANSGAMIVGLLGLLAATRQSAMAWVLVYMVFSKIVVHAVLFSTPRYGLHLVPVLAVGLAYEVARIGGFQPAETTDPALYP